MYEEIVMNKFQNKTFEYIFVFLFIIVLFTAVASYFYYKSDNAVGPNLITAFVGVVMSALVTLVLLNGQTKDEEEKERILKLYNAKLRVYSDFVSKMFEILSDNHITEEEFSNLRTRLLGKVCFYVNNKEVLEGIKKELDSIKDYTDNNKMAQVFASITSILQRDLRKDWYDTKKDVSDLWGSFERILANTNTEEGEPELESVAKDVFQQEESTLDGHERLEQQAWHFIMLNDMQIEKLKEGFKELSLIEYEEDWRTNLVKQVAENDVIMLFRRGGYGYVGAYKTIGWRVFYFEEEREELHLFSREIQEIKGDQYLSDIKQYDIYDSYNDNATSCANIIVEPIAFVENGVGNPGGVYRRTISRYDSHYAWMLKEEFKKVGQWIDE